MNLLTRFTLLFASWLCLINGTVLEDYRSKIEPFWADGLTIDFTGRNGPYYEVLDRPSYPLFWNEEGYCHAIYLESGQGKGIVFVDDAVENMFAAQAGSTWFQRWRDIIFSGKPQTFNEIKANMEENKGDWGITVFDNSPSVNWSDLIELWKNGETGPLFIMTYRIEEIGKLLGFREEIYKAGFSMSSSRKLTYKTISIGGLLEAYAENLDVINQQPLKFDPSMDDEKNQVYSHYKVVGEAVFKFLSSVQNDFESIVGRWGYNYKGKYNMLQAMTVLKISMMQALITIDTEKYKQLKSLYGFMYGLREGDGFVDPPLVDLKVRVPQGYISFHQNLGVYSIPNEKFTVTISEYFYGDLIIGAAYDTLAHKSSTKRVPLAVQRCKLYRDFLLKQECFTPVGGPMSFNSEGYAPDMEYVFQKVALVPGININDPASLIRWNNGYFKNTKLQWAELYCDSIYMTLPTSSIENYTTEELVKICLGTDRANKGMHVFAYDSVEGDHKKHFQFEPNPGYGAAHAGHPTVCPVGWFHGPIVAGKGLDGGKYKSWGFLHEMGHNVQSTRFTHWEDWEVTNNVLVVFVTTYMLNCNYEDGMFHPGIYNVNGMENYINTGEGMGIFWRRLIYFYTIATDMGFGAISNTWGTQKGNSHLEFLRALSKVSGLNCAGYGLFMRALSETEAKTLYDEMFNFPTYKPVGYLTPGSFNRWAYVQEKLNFTKTSQGVPIDFPFSFDRDWDKRYRNDYLTILKTY